MKKAGLGDNLQSDEASSMSAITPMQAFGRNQGHLD